MAEKPEGQHVASPPAASRGKARRTQPAEGKATAALDKAAARARRPDGWRETIESIVVAFVLAFLFRTFEAEAFVIPTGSMAPTLYGQHRDVYCEKCGTRFATGASSGNAVDAEIRNGKIVPNYRSHFAVCPNANCRFPNDVMDREIFAGDRILVNKFPYDFADPERWDVVVFKFPEGAKTNYIKRLVGLPGEEVRLEGGDVKVRRPDADDVFRIARKSPEKQRRLQIPVYDDDHPARELLAAGWPEAWDNEADSQWSADRQARAYRVDADPLDSNRWHWLRYTNYAPLAANWQLALAGQRITTRPEVQKVGDFYAYNARITAGEADVAVSRGELAQLFGDNGSEWVGDLTVNCTVEVLAPIGALLLELVEGPRRYRCEINLETGQGLLSYQHEQAQDDAFEPVGLAFDTALKAAGKYALSFANVDDRLCVWVDDQLVKSLDFEIDSRYPPADPASQKPTKADSAPVGVAALGAKVRVSHLRVERDVFYRNEDPPGVHADREMTYRLRDDPDDADDEFLMLGDNSPKSNDSRLWVTSYAVPRRLLIGKAFFIYWPHGVPFLNGGRGFPVWSYGYDVRSEAGVRRNPTIPQFSLPFYPQVARMRRIR
ncbi:MAG: signal peptidase I [Planctomycetaceae bacterium]